MPLEQEEIQLVPDDIIESRETISSSTSFDSIHLAEEASEGDDELLMESHLVPHPQEPEKLSDEAISDDLTSANSFECSEVEAEEASKIKMKFIHLLLDDGDRVSAMLRGKDQAGNFPKYLGVYRLLLLRTVCAIVLLN